MTDSLPRQDDAAHPYSRVDTAMAKFGEVGGHGKVVEQVTVEDSYDEETGVRHWEGYTLYEDGHRVPMSLTEQGWGDR